MVKTKSEHKDKYKTDQPNWHVMKLFINVTFKALSVQQEMSTCSIVVWHVFIKKKTPYVAPHGNVRPSSQQSCLRLLYCQMTYFQIVLKDYAKLAQVLGVFKRRTFMLDYWVETW